MNIRPQFDRGGRRLRHRRSPSGKRIAVGARDLAILRWLYRYRYLDSRQLIRILQPRSSKRLIERLGDLFHETGLINRPPMHTLVHSLAFDRHCSALVYEIADAGIELLTRSGQLPDRAVTLSRRRSSRQLTHATLIVESLLAIELATLTNPNQRFVPVDEILARAPVSTRSARNPLAVPVTIEACEDFPQIRRPWRTHIIPDALYGIEYCQDGGKGYRFWALECDCSTPQTRTSAIHSSLARKKAAYAALLSSRAFRDHWSIPNLKLHQVTVGDHSSSAG